MESLAKLVVLIGVVFTLIIEFFVVLAIIKLFPNLGKWWFLVGPLTILISFGVSLIVLKTFTSLNK